MKQHYVVVFENSCVLSFEESEEKAKERVSFFERDGIPARYDTVDGPIPAHTEEAARAYERTLAARANNVVQLFPTKSSDGSGLFPLQSA